MENLLFNGASFSKLKEQHGLARYGRQGDQCNNDINCLGNVPGAYYGTSCQAQRDANGKLLKQANGQILNTCQMKPSHNQ